MFGLSVTGQGKWRVDELAGKGWAARDSSRNYALAAQLRQTDT